MKADTLRVPALQTRSQARIGWPSKCAMKRAIACVGGDFESATRVRTPPSRLWCYLSRIQQFTAYSNGRQNRCNRYAGSSTTLKTAGSIARWCNGSTVGSEPICRGSNPWWAAAAGSNPAPILSGSSERVGASCPAKVEHRCERAQRYRRRNGSKCYGSTSVSKTESAGSTPAHSAISNVHPYPRLPRYPLAWRNRDPRRRGQLDAPHRLPCGG